MKEIEILVRVYNPVEYIKNKLSKFEYLKTQEIIDKYYYDPLRQDLKPDAKNQLNSCLRIRTTSDSSSLTYKIDHFDNGKWLYSDEYETAVESSQMCEKILHFLGMKEILIIKNNKNIYKYYDYEIVLEEVEDLGLFLEV